MFRDPGGHNWHRCVPGYQIKEALEEVVLKQDFGAFRFQKHEVVTIKNNDRVPGLNGLMFAVLVGGVAWVWFASPALGGVIALAMAINLLTAGVTGSVLPVVLQRAGFDPAVASSALLTSITDVVGFYVFLALAAVLLL